MSKIEVTAWIDPIDLEDDIIESADADTLAEELVRRMNAGSKSAKQAVAKHLVNSGYGETDLAILLDDLEAARGDAVHFAVCMTRLRAKVCPEAPAGRGMWVMQMPVKPNA